MTVEELLTDWFETTIDDSFDLGWTSRDAATLIVSRMQAEGLVLINREGMRDRVIEAVWNCSFHPDDVASGEAQRRIAEWPADYAQAQKRADAAIAAILGGQP